MQDVSEARTAPNKQKLRVARIPVGVVRVPRRLVLGARLLDEELVIHNVHALGARHRLSQLRCVWVLSAQAGELEGPNDAPLRQASRK